MELKEQKKKVKKPVKSVNLGLKVRQAGKESEELFSSAQKGAGSDLKKPQAAATAKKEANTQKNSKRKSAIDEKSSSYGVIQSEYNAIKIVNPEAPLERIDPESGLPVYKAHLLKVGEGGGTPLCPFDCNCCF
jgi:hypothetical protein